MKPSELTVIACTALAAFSSLSFATEVKPPATQPATAPAAEVRDPLKFSEQADAGAKARRSVIEEEVKALREHAWAGQYYFGDGLGANVSLWLAPQSGFLYQWHGCLGLYDRNYGAVATAGKETVQLLCDLEGSHIATEYIPIRWGTRRYLVARGQMQDFCEAINKGREPRKYLHGRFFIRNGDEQKVAEGLPDLPEEYRKHLTLKLDSE